MKFITSFKLCLALIGVLAGANFTVTIAQICPGSAGCLDQTFNGTGKLLIPQPGNGGSSGQWDSLVQSDGKVVSLVDNKVSTATMVRVNTDGTLDPTFGSGGIVYTSWHYHATYPFGYAYGLAIQNVAGEERLVVAGIMYYLQGRNTVTKLRVDRYLPNGVPDTSFGTGGTTILDTGYANRIAVQASDQKILTVGDPGILVRLTANGALDTGFGSGGQVAIGYSSKAVKILNNGKIAVGGTLSSGNTKSMAVTSVISNGSIDTAFGTSGRATATFFGTGSIASTFGLAEDALGNIVAVGTASRNSSGYGDFAVARFTSNGLPDSSFNATGRATYDFAGFSDNAKRVLMQNDSKMVVTGYAQLTSNSRSNDFALIRINFNGSLDTTFGTGGRVTTDVDDLDLSNAGIIWTDPFCSCQKVIIAGGSWTGFSFARYMTYP